MQRWQIDIWGQGAGIYIQKWQIDIGGQGAGIYMQW